MPNKVHWEWSIVTWEKDLEDIIDLDFADSLAEFYQDDLRQAIECGEDDDGYPITLEVIRWEVDKHGYTQDRCYAASVGGILDTHTAEGHKLPGRLQAELKRTIKKMKGNENVS